MAFDHQIDAAYYQGLREGFDPEMAAEIGIPISPEDVERHIESAQRVAELTGPIVVAETIEPEPPNIVAEKTRMPWIDTFDLKNPTTQQPEDSHEWTTSLQRLTNPRSSGPLTYKTPDERAHVTDKVTEQKRLIEPTRKSED